MTTLSCPPRMLIINNTLKLHGIMSAPDVCKLLETHGLSSPMNISYAYDPEYRSILDDIWSMLFNDEIIIKQKTE